MHRIASRSATARDAETTVRRACRRRTLGLETSSSERGYTLIEGVIALALVAVIAATVFAVYLVAARQVAIWQTQFAVTNDLHLIQQRLTTDLRHTHSVAVQSRDDTANEAEALHVLTPEHSLILIGADSTMTTYTRTETAWLRNARPTHRDDLVLARATVQRIYIDDQGERVQVRGSEMPIAPVLTDVRLTFVLGRDTSTVSARGLTRLPQQWPRNEP